MYKQRYRSICHYLAHHLGKGFSYSPVAGGMFLWLQLGVKDTWQLAERCLAKGVAVVPGSEFYPDRRPSPALRLNFTNSDDKQLDQACATIARVLQKLSGSGVTLSTQSFH